MVSMRPRETSPCWGMGGDEGKLGLPGSTQGLPVEAEARPLVAEAELDSQPLRPWTPAPEAHPAPPPLNPGGRKERAEVLNQESPLKTLVSETRALMRGRRRLPYLDKQLSLSLPPKQCSDLLCNPSEFAIFSFPWIHSYEAYMSHGGKWGQSGLNTITI